MYLWRFSLLNPYLSYQSALSLTRFPNCIFQLGWQIRKTPDSTSGTPFDLRHILGINFLEINLVLYPSFACIFPPLRNAQMTT